ncbi:MAG: MFS transporter [Egibacteraceae bacterium]
MFERVLAGLATGRHRAANEPVGEAVEPAVRIGVEVGGVAAVLRRTARKPEQLVGRDLSEVAASVLMVDGICFAGEVCVVALAITVGGRVWICPRFKVAAQPSTYTRARPGGSTGKDAMPGRQPTPFREPAFVVALVIAVVVALGFGLVVPVLPLFARAFDVGLFAVTLVVAVFAAVRLVSNVYAGALSDRIGTSRAVGWGALIVAASSLLTAVSPNYWALVVFRGLGGLGSALFFTALLALVVRIVPAQVRGRAVGLLQAAFLFGTAFGPSVGGVLAEPLGLRWPFAIYAGFCGGAGLVALRFLPRADAPAPPHPVHVGALDANIEAPTPARRPRGLGQTVRLTRELCADRAFLAALVMMAGSWAAIGLRFGLVPVFGAEVVGADKTLVGTALTVAAVAQLCVLWPTGKLVDTVGRKAVAGPTYLLAAVTVLGLAWATTVPLFLAAMALVGVGTGLSSVTPPAIVADVVPLQRAGVGVGILNTAGDVGNVVGPLVSGLLAERLGYAWGFGSIAAMLAAGGLVALGTRETMPGRALPATDGRVP